MILYAKVPYLGQCSLHSPKYRIDVKPKVVFRSTLLLLLSVALYVAHQ